MPDTILCLAPQLSCGGFDRQTLETISAAKSLKDSKGAKLVIGTWGKTPEQTIGAAEADEYLLIEGEAYQSPKYSTDIVASETLVKKSGASIVLAPSNPRIQRFLSGLSIRVNGQVDTHVTQVEVIDGDLVATRWYYRQRMEAKIKRDSANTWLMSIESGCYEAIETGATSTFTAIDSPEVASRTQFKKIESTSSGDQTIRPDSKLLFVAGAGWTKKQGDGSIQTDKAENLILDFVQKKQASLGSSKSMVDLSSEGQAVLPFLTHLHQIGQTGSTPRHVKGLATCCHGEEPHAVGWRFIQERRAINLDGNCGWAHGKADVLYVADAFEVMELVNAKI